MTSTSKKSLTLAEILEIWEEDDICEDIFIQPPDVNDLTDEDSDQEDGMNMNINTLSRNQLMAHAEIRQTRKDIEVYSPPNLTPGKKTKKKKQQNVYWSRGGETVVQRDFPLFYDDSCNEMTSANYFELFFDDILVEKIIDESRDYCLSKNLPDIQLSKEELRAFFAILIVSGYNRLPGKAMYWNNGEDLRNNAIYKAMRRDRFDNIMSALHFKSNLALDKSDKYSKLRPLFSHIQKKCMQYYIPSEAISHDEAMVEYFGKHGCKQAIRCKPIRFGYKIWCQNSTSGYLIAFDPYQGKTFQGDEEIVNEFDKCASTVLHLLDQYPLGKSNLPYHIYIDNLFTTIPLMRELKIRGYNCIGTIRANRLGKDCCLENLKEFEKKERGHIEVATAKLAEHTFYLCRWKDNAVVSVASTCFSADPILTVKRWSKSERKHMYVSIPYSIHSYDKNMGGTDRMNQNINIYRIPIRGKKWWWSLFTWMLDVSVQNAWLLAREKNKNLKQLTFRRDLAMSYLLFQRNLPKAAGRKPTKPAGVEAIRFDRFDHFVQKTKNNKQRRCAGINCKSTIRTECSKCNVGLCITCFHPYHNNQKH